MNKEIPEKVETDAKPVSLIKAEKDLETKEAATVKTGPWPGEDQHHNFGSHRLYIQT